MLALCGMEESLVFDQIMDFKNPFYVCVGRIAHISHL